MKAALLVVVVLGAIAGTAHAHKNSDGHLRLAVDGTAITGQLDLGVRDLDAAVGLDADGDGNVRWREVLAAEPAIEAYVQAHLALAGNGRACALTVRDAPALVALSDGAYFSMPLRAACPSAPTTLTIDYRLLFEVDALHHGLVRITSGPDAQTVIIREPGSTTVDIGGSTSFVAFVRLGVWHIWIGLDHILFLVALLLPSLLTRAGSPLRTFRTIAREVLEIVTAFTLAHSITLIISAVGLVSLPSRLVETAIAASVAVAAINNLVRAVDARWAVAFALGLLHGFGFSSVLLDVGLPSDELVSALLGFNLGVEVGQLAIVLALLPLLYVVRRTRGYRWLVLVGSAAIALLALYWSIQRFVA